MTTDSRIGGDIDIDQDPNPLLDWMRQNGVPITRKKYIALNWGSNIPDPWTPNDEDMLPDQLQDWSLFSADDKFIYPLRT